MRMADMRVIGTSEGLDVGYTAQVVMQLHECNWFVRAVEIVTADDAYQHSRNVSDGEECVRGSRGECVPAVGNGDSCRTPPSGGTSVNCTSEPPHKVMQFLHAQ